MSGTALAAGELAKNRWLAPFRSPGRRASDVKFWIICAKPKRVGKYVIYIRAFCYDNENQRRIGRIETDDPLQPWPYTKTDNDRMFPSIDNLPVVLSADKEDDPHSDIYYNASTIYYSSGRLHDSAILRPEYDEAAKQMGGVGVVRQRLDGFVSADADHKGGWLTTPPIVFRGNRLRLNIDTGSMGTAFVELQDADGRPIPGFTVADCEEIGGNFIDQQVHWKSNADVSSLAGKPMRLKVTLKRAKLYAFQFTKE